jgi:hypothetical protein
VSTRLQLCNKLRQLAGIGAGSTGAGLVTTLNQTGEYKRVVDWIDAAWNLIQLERKWDWMWTSGGGAVILANEYLVEAVIPAHRYVKDSLFIGTTRLVYRPWHKFQQEHPAPLIGSGEPSVWTVRPDMKVAVNRKPTAETTITLDFYNNPTAMAADSDVPTGLPTPHHDIIVYKALIEYANFEEAGVTRATAIQKYNEHFNVLSMHAMPEWTFGDPLC